MELYILRHGIAVQHGAVGMHDEDRPLSAKGEIRTRQVAQGIKTLALPIDAVLSSPLLRAKRTAEIVKKKLSLKAPIHVSTLLKPESPPKGFVKEIQKPKYNHQNVLCVGHEPFLSALISILLIGTTDVMLDMKKAGLCCLAFDTGPNPKNGVLKWFLTPKQLCVLGGHDGTAS